MRNTQHIEVHICYFEKSNAKVFKHYDWKPTITSTHACARNFRLSHLWDDECQVHRSRLRKYSTASNKGVFHQYSNTKIDYHMLITYKNTYFSINFF